ncbi:MAG: DUF4760 domain-containing protein [Proteobacteria bacterium]|nr:DUF4760 domain-containing protein [Pseudomonadota bacterium]
MTLAETLSLAGTLILFSGLVVAIFQLSLLGKQVRLMFEHMNKQFDWTKKQSTFEYMSMYQKELMPINVELQKRFNLLVQDGRDITESEIEHALNNDNIRSQLFSLIFYFEHLAIGIEQEYFYERIAREFLSNVVISTFNSIYPYIQVRRKETNREIAKHFEHLARKWEKNR